MSTARTITYPARAQVRCDWLALDAGETGDSVDVARWQEKSIQIPAAGTSTITVQGSNDGTNWATLHSKDSASGDPIDLAALAAGLYSILENPRLIRVVAAAGDTNDLAIVLFGVKSET